ncbi:ATP-binding protein [Streptomyces lichenis]|uniref:histidine kinase n=1 Tax=Streptomyces lichenis TaxID=2306967 RepID=A0ABT0I465_9ACTN|nr:ATP-binding protein [Streptomyces lichenis]MCK8676104.1 hypothetical protein [Streptomyces lichenis]
MTELIWTIAALVAAVASVAAALYQRRAARRERRRADRLEGQARDLGGQLRAAEQFIGHLAGTAVPAAATAAQHGQEHRVELPVPPQLVNTPLATGLGVLAEQLGGAVAAVGRHARADTEQRLGLARQEAEERIAAARRESVDVARAAVRSFASSTVQRAAKLSTRISAGVRRHVSDEAYVTLVEIDHLAQQMLLTASGYAVLSGDKLSRRWPTTTLTDVVRSAMGRVEGYERVQHPDMDTLSVESRAVEAVVHALAVLLDNALRYSPPNARVHVSLEHGHNAAFLIVDDAGLRMEDERLTWAREVMSGVQRDDITRLGAYPQTGLRVASVLAEDYGFRVDVTAPNIYGGTRAVIVLPPALLTTPAPARPATAAAVRAVPTARREAPEPVAAASTTASGLTIRRRTARPAPARRALPAADAVEPGSPGMAAAWLAGTRSGRENAAPADGPKDPAGGRADHAAGAPPEQPSTPRTPSAPRMNEGH